MTQDFSLRHPLVKGQGNFGSIDGDSAAAYRYTEAKLEKMAEEILKDLEKDTVPFKDNFDASSKEPEVLPSKLPNLLINGSSGIAVGMSTNIPPHNLKETCSAAIHLIDNPDATIPQLMEFIPGPDFPTGAEVFCGQGLLQAYTHGKGKIKIKATAQVEEDKIIFTQMPYQVNKAETIIQIAQLVKDKRIEGIRNINDESDREGIRVVVDLKKGADGYVILNQLYKYSRLKVTFGIQFLALVDRQPKVLSLKQMLQYYIDHREVIVTRRTQFLLNKAQARAHILQGLLIALNDIDKIIKGIKESKTINDARNFLEAAYSLSEDQVRAILDMKLQKLASLEQQKIQTEFGELEIAIKGFEELLSLKENILGVVKSELEEMKELYGNPRKSKLLFVEDDDIDDEDLIEEEQIVITQTNKGYLKRVPIDTYRTQRRGGRGVQAAQANEEDFVESVYVTSTHNYLLCFSTKGQLYWIKGYKIPQGSRQAKGKHIANILDLKDGETISAIIPIKDFKEGFLFMATKRGVVKKTDLESFSNVRKGGIRAITLDEDDSLIGVKHTSGNQEILLATRKGIASRFNEKDVRSMGRTAHGVRGIRLNPDDEVMSMISALKDHSILTLTKRGYGKRTLIDEYRLCKRGGKGVTNIKVTDKNGEVVTAMLSNGEEELMLISTQGIGIRVPTKNISQIGRATQGVRVMKLGQDDTLAAAAKIVIDEDEEVEKNDNE
jgi:DNA gyrase subunit A